MFTLPAGATHNNYSQYVLEPADLVGLIAYSLYKQHKIKFLEEEFRKTGQPATSGNIDIFCSLYGQPHQVELLRMDAHRLLSGLNDRLLAPQIQDLRQQYQEELIRQLKEGGGMAQATKYSIVGNIATGALFALVVWIANANFGQVLEVVQRPFKKTESTQEVPASQDSVTPTTVLPAK